MTVSSPSSPDGRPTPVIVHLSGRARGTTRRLAGDHLVIGTGADADVHVSPLDLPTTSALDPGSGHLATLERRGAGYGITADPGADVRLNGKKVDRAPLVSGDVIEIGRGGPVMRYRLYRPGKRPYKTMVEAFSDCVDCARRDEGGALRRGAILIGGTLRELATETFPVTRIAVLVLVAFLLGVSVTLWLRTGALERELAETRRVPGLSELVQGGESDSFTSEDFAGARRDLEGRLEDTVARIEALETRAGARSAVIAEAARSVVFLQAAYGFVDDATGRPLRYAAPGAAASAAPGGMPVTLEGDGPLIEVFYTGTGFIATADGKLLTNRHVALPWDFDETALLVAQQGFRPVMRRFVGFLPGEAEPFDVEVVAVSDDADLALLRGDLPASTAVSLGLARDVPGLGTEVIVLGYPTGMRALLARADADLLAELESSAKPLDFWEVARRLAAEGVVAPLATVGVVGQTTPGSVVYDAETTHGGSGGPVLDLDGRVVAVNSAIVPEFGGSNLGVPASEARALLERAARETAPDGPSGPSSR